jgi:hypothetical protein
MARGLAAVALLQDGGDYTGSHAGYETAKISGNDFVFESRERAFILTRRWQLQLFFNRLIARIYRRRKAAERADAPGSVEKGIALLSTMRGFLGCRRPFLHRMRLQSHRRRAAIFEPCPRG